MFASSFTGLLQTTKARLRRFPPAATANRLLKARRLRTGLQRLAEHYADLAAAQSGWRYDEDAAWTEARRRMTATQELATPQGCLAQKPRIFWVGSNRDQDESGFLQALRRIATVVEFQNWKGGYGQWYWDESGRVQLRSPAVVAQNDNALKTQIDAALQAGRIDLLMGQMWANFISKETLSQVRQRGIPVINISMDDRLPDNWSAHQGTRLGAIGLAPACDLVLTTSSETCAWFGAEGHPAVFWPLASDPNVFKPAPDATRDIDVLFIGNKYGIRESIVNTLMRRGIRVDCYGSGWVNGPSTAEQSASLFKRARIILGVGTVGHCHDVFTLKLRDFDAPMSGALYLTHRNQDLARLYQEGAEIECYATPQEAADKIHYYLAHPHDLATIAAAGHARALARDTWGLRLETTFARLGLLRHGCGI